MSSAKPAIAVILIALLATTAWAVTASPSKIASAPQHINFCLSWGNQSNSLKELTQKSTLVVVGNVVKSESFAESLVAPGTKIATGARIPPKYAFTEQYIKVEKVLKGKCKVGDTIPVLQMGGVTSTVESTPPNECPLLNISTKYLLFVEKAQPNYPYYHITGGYQGRALIDRDGSVQWEASIKKVLTSMSKDASLVDDLSGKSVNTLLDVN